MYNILEKDTGRRINFTARSHDRGTHRRSYLPNKGRQAFQGEQQMLDTGTKEYATF